MIDLPPSREPFGITQLQQIMRDIEYLKDTCRMLEIQPSPTVQPNKTPIGTTLNAAAATTQQQSNRQVWL